MAAKSSIFGLMLLLFTFLNLLATPTPAQAVANNPDVAFLDVWERTDYPVGLGAAQRSWYWGIAPYYTSSEVYNEAPNSVRRVQYWDKSRMEITNPNANQNSKWYVTNGLLVRELVTGKLQIGDNDYLNLTPANVPVGGDPAIINPDAPTYASFKDVVSLNLDKRANRSSGAVNATIDKAGNVGSNASLASRYPETTIAYYEDKLGHNIPAPFWRFMNASGTVTVNHRYTTQVIEDWLFAMGFPISEPYWTRARVGGVEKDILVQLFERRILTYTPSNNAAFQVEMGNVGLHYFNWRYGNNPVKPLSYYEPSTRLTIPAIGVDAAIEYVGRAADNSMDVPAKPENVAWYKLGARIGERGNAVIAGHLDYYNIGAVVFWNLNKLKPGDLIYITTTMGTRLTFKVTGSEAYPFDRAPRDRIFGDSNTANLNLITCNGVFDRGTANYSQRLVVYSTLVS